MWFVAWLACGDPSGHPHEHVEVEAGHAPDPHAAHKGGSDHMKEMTSTREALRTELGDAYDAPVAGLEQADAAAGKALYETHCASCHGAGGKGDGSAADGLNPPPSDFTDAFHARFYSDAGRVRVIQKGAAGTAMVGFEGVLQPQQVLEVYAHVRSLRPSAGGVK